MRYFRKHTQYGDIEIFRRDRGNEIDIVSLTKEEVINYNSLANEGICDRIIVKPLKEHYQGGDVSDYSTYLNCHHGLPEMELGIPRIEVYIKAKENNNGERNLR